MTLQRYRSHKVVEAGLIQGIRYYGDTPLYVMVGGKQYTVPADFCARGKPEVGDSYLVRYEDGYLSWSPRAAFEAGYTLVEGDVRLHIEPAKMGAKPMGAPKQENPGLLVGEGFDEPGNGDG